MKCEKCKFMKWCFIDNDYMCVNQHSPMFGENISPADTCVKHPCQNCIYFKQCGNTNRTEPCKGRVTKNEQQRTRNAI